MACASPSPPGSASPVTAAADGSFSGIEIGAAEHGVTPIHVYPEVKGFAAAPGGVRREPEVRSVTHNAPGGIAW